jgi:curved DNA-binding protein CbpA
MEEPLSGTGTQHAMITATTARHALLLVRPALIRSGDDMSEISRDAYEVLHVHPKAHDLVIRAAYRTLSRLYHPDNSPGGDAAERMAELNAAYQLVRTPEARAVYDAWGRRSTANIPVVPDAPQPAFQTARPPVRPDTLDFGRYAGWTIEQLVHQDPAYLEWLSRHSSGIRYRRQIEAAFKRLRPGSPVVR